MRRFAFLCVALLACHAPPRPAPAAPLKVAVGAAPNAPLTAPVSDQNLVVPCTKDQEPSAQVIDDLRLALSNAKDADPVAPLVATLERIVATPCYAIARLDRDVKLTFDSVASLRRWWDDGGESWLTGYPRAEETSHAIFFPPTVRTTLTSEKAPPELKPLLCPLKALDDLSCGVESTGWRMRVGNGHWKPPSDGHSAYCENYARNDTSGATKYAVFHSCVDDGEHSDVLPLGAFQAPKDGWLIVARTRFIHLQGCQDAVSLYDLASGAAYIVGCREPKSRSGFYVGRAPTGALREAALMMMLEHVAEPVRPLRDKVPVPSSIPVARRPGEDVPSRIVSIDVSDMPGIEWAWVRGNPLKGAMSGRFRTSTNGIAAHAYSLFEIADAAFQEGCAPLSLPKIPWDDVGPRVGGPSESWPLFSGAVDARATLAHAPAAKAGCPMIP